MNKNEADQARMLDEAIDLIIRLQNDPDNPVALEMIAGWRARSAEHERIWRKVSGAHGMSGKILTDRAKAASRAKAKVTRRKFMIGGAAGLGAVAAGSILVPDAILSARADFITKKGEIRRVDLDDGSVATLGPESALALDYGLERRGLELLKGMAFFEVTKDPARPFVVATSELTATALGTAFDMSEDAGLVGVSVAEGEVETHSRDIGGWASATLNAGDWIRFDASTRTVDRGKYDVGQIAAWRQALIVADNAPVSALVARIGRWYPGRIVVADPYVGSHRVSGLFDLREPERALEAVVHPAGAHVRRVSSYLTIIAPF